MIKNFLAVFLEDGNVRRDRFHVSADQKNLGARLLGLCNGGGVQEAPEDHASDGTMESHQWERVHAGRRIPLCGTAQHQLHWATAAQKWDDDERPVAGDAHLPYAAGGAECGRGSRLGEGSGKRRGRREIADKVQPTLCHRQQ